jgi:hypothetical protein
MADNVKLLKLITGEEVLAEVSDSIVSDKILIKNAVRVVVMPNKLDPKTPNVGFAPWADFSDDKTVTLDKSHIIAIMSPIKEFVNQYNSMFGGLVVPTSNLILPG